MNARLRFWLVALLLSASVCGTVYAAPVTRIDLAGIWKFHVDPDDSGLSKGWQTAGYDAKFWQPLIVPGEWEKQGVTQANPNWTKDTSDMPYSGYAWYRRAVTIPAEWKGRKVFFNAGNIDDDDFVFINGVMIGQTVGADATAPQRKYGISAGVVIPGKPAIIAVRVLDRQGYGGITAGPVTLTVDAPEPAAPVVSPVPAPAPGVTVTSDGDAVKIGDDVLVDAGQTVRNATAVRGDVIVKGHVTESAVAVLGNVHVLPGGVVDGDVVAVLGSVNKEPGAVLNGTETSIGLNGAVTTSGKQAPTATGAHPFQHRGGPGVIFAILLFALIAIATVALYPKRIEMVASTVSEKPGLSAVYGVIAGPALLLIAGTLLITCIGIPLIVVEALLAVLAWIAGKVAIYLIVGRRVSSAVHRPIASTVLAAVLGAGILSIIELVPILGMLVVCAVTVVGFGAVIMTGFGADDRWLITRFRKPTPPGPEAPSADEPAGTVENIE